MTMQELDRVHDAELDAMELTGREPRVAPQCELLGRSLLDLSATEIDRCERCTERCQSVGGVLCWTAE